MKKKISKNQTKRDLRQGSQLVESPCQKTSRSTQNLFCQSISNLHFSSDRQNSQERIQLAQNKRVRPCSLTEDYQSTDQALISKIYQKSSKNCGNPSNIEFNKLKKIKQNKRKMNDRKTSQKSQRPVQSSGEFHIGRLKPRYCAKKVTYKDAQLIYECQCGKLYLSYMGIYCHIKQKHLKKNQNKVFKLQIFQDSLSGKTIKRVILQNSDFKIQSQNKPTEIEKVNQKIVKKDDVKIKYEEFFAGNNQTEQSNEYSSVNNKLQTFDNKKKVEVVSLIKYQELMKECKQLLSKLFNRQKQQLQKTSQLIQVIENYKFKTKLLTFKLKNCQTQLDQFKNAQKQDKFDYKRKSSSTQINEQQILQTKVLGFSISYDQCESSFDPEIKEIPDQSSKLEENKYEQKTVKNKTLQPLLEDPQNHKIQALLIKPDKISEIFNQTIITQKNKQKIQKAQPQQDSEKIKKQG